MEKIKINHYIKKEETIFGSLKVDNVIFDAKAMEEYIYKYVLTKENLEYIFCDKITNDRQYLHMIKRFLPAEDVYDYEKYVDEQVEGNKAFYSFFAEALLPLVYKDVYGYQLQEAAIDITQTLVDTSTGVDGCLYDPLNSAFVAGEAKFYKTYADGLKSIVDAFTSNKSIINKLGSLYNKMINNADMDCIILKKLGKSGIEDYSLNEFLSLKLRFSGFVLHEASSINIKKIYDEDFYDNYWITTSDIYNNIKKNKLDIDGLDCGITMFHFIINSKRDLIVKCIKHALEIKKGILNNE